MLTDISHYQALFRKEFSTSQDIEAALQLLRSEGISIVDAVRVVKFELRILLIEADKIVLNSDVWKSNKEEIENFREKFWNVIQEYPEDGLNSSIS